jgi:hypothetical protein
LNRGSANDRRLNCHSAPPDEFTFVFGDPDGDYSVWKYHPETADFGAIKTVLVSPRRDDELARSVEQEERDLQNADLQKSSLPQEHQRLCEQLGGQFFVACRGGNISVGLGEEALVNLALQPDWVRCRFPRLVLWGNMSSSFVQNATAAEVREESRRIVAESGGTGYFQGCSNAIVKGTPPKNVEAMYSVR